MTKNLRFILALVALTVVIGLAILVTPAHAQTQNQILPSGARGGGVVVSTSTSPTATLGTIATSSLGISSSDIVEGSKLFFTNARAIAALLTGFSSTTGTVTSSDSILTAIQKIVGNAAAYLTNITGYLAAGTNVTVTGSGTLASPYVINASGGGSGGGISTTTPWTAGQLVQVVDNGTVNSIATSSLGLGASFFQQNGNSFGTTATFGTNDAQSLAFETNNATRMTILSTGNVGIGTTTPSYALDVQSANTFATVLRLTGGATGVGDNTQLRFAGRMNGELFSIGTDISTNNGTRNFQLYDLKAGATRLTVGSGGNVGIGTTSPYAKLSIVGTGGTTRDLVVNGRIQTGDANNQGGIWFGQTNQAQFIGQQSATTLGFYMNSDWRMAIDSSGNVGIGTTSPSQKLQVQGNVRITGALYDSSNSAGTNGYVLQTTSTGTAWVATSTLGISGGSGTVTSVAASVPTGLTVTGSPITTAGTLAFGWDTGYGPVLTASSTNWDTAYTNRITSATAPLSISSNVISITANGIGDTQLAFDTGQNLTTASSPSFTGLTIGSGSGVLKVASGVVSVGADGTDYTLVDAQSCTNQVITAITAAGVSTCSTVSNAMLANSTISGIALGSNLADLTATNATLSFSGAYNGGTARTVGLNLGNANTWTVGQTFNAGITATGATSTISQASLTTAVDFLGDYVTNTATWIRSKLSAGFGLVYSAGQFAIDTTGALNGECLKYNSTGPAILWDTCAPSGGPPVGSLMPYASTTPPTGYLLADGTAVSRATYSDLFATIGTTYGAGDGSTTFTLPNLKSRGIMGYNSGDTKFDTLGETGGEQTHTMTEAELVAHTHPGVPASGGPSEGTNGSIWELDASGSTGSTGGGTPFNVLDPYIAMPYIIKF